MKVSVSLSWSFSRQWVTVSQQQPNRSVRGAELSRDQTTSTPAARAELDIHGPARAAGAGWWAPALPISSLCIQFPFPTFLHWHQLEFPQKCSWEMGKICEVSNWLETRLDLIFCRLQLIPWSSKSRFLCRDQTLPGRCVLESFSSCM